MSDNESCFGKMYSSDATECQGCEVKKECKIAMAEEDRKKNVEMPCFVKEYVAENYACRKSCYIRDECRRIALGEDPPEVEVSGAQDITPEPIVPKIAKVPTVATPTVAVEAPKVVTATVEDPVDGSEPELIIEGRMGKKAIVRAALKAYAISGGISSDDIVQLMIDHKQVEDSEVNRKKNREYVSMCVSELKKMESMVIERVGGKYVLTGESS